MKIKVSELKKILPLIADKIREISWVTGKHYADDAYDVGEFVSAHTAGDWTDHPKYSGVRRDERPDHYKYAVEWFAKNLPDDPDKELTVRLF